VAADEGIGEAQLHRHQRIVPQVLHALLVARELPVEAGERDAHRNRELPLFN